MVYLALINRIGEVFNTRGIHIAIDGKGLRVAARKVKGEKTPYILNAIHGNGGGGVVFQVKKNCPELYAELMGLFEGFEGNSKSRQKQKGWIMARVSTMYWMKHLERIKAP